MDLRQPKSKKIKYTVASYLLVKIQQRRSVISEFLQEIDGNVSDTEVIPEFK